MPLYLIHGFKWDHVSIIKPINYNHVSRASFRKLWPDIMTRLPNLYFFEEFDPPAS